MRTARKRRYYYGWNIVGAALLSRFSFVSGNASFLSLYFIPLNAEFGWTRTAVAGVLTVSRVVEGLTSPIIGPAIDRYGARFLMVAGGIVVGVGFLLLMRLNSLWEFYLVRGVFMGVGFALMGFVVTNTAISNWFIKRRGRAIAIVSTGVNFASLFLAPLTVWIIATRGWRNSWLLFALMTWLVVVIPSGLLMRRRPEDMGLRPDGDERESNVGPASHTEATSQKVTVNRDAEPVWTRGEVLRNRSFWLLIAGISTAMLAFQGINISIAPYTLDLGFGNALVATMFIVRSVFTLMVTPAWVVAAERLQVPYVRTLPFFIQMVACILFLFADQQAYLWLGVAVYGAGSAGMMIVQEVLWANYFGRLTLGTVRSTSFPIQVFFSAGGPILINLIFDITGTYRPAYALFIGLFLVGALFIWLARPPVARNYVQV